MLRRIALRRVELGAGVAAAVIGALTLPMALLAPLYAVCPGACPPERVRYVALLAAHPDASIWALLLGLLALTLAGAAAAVADARVAGQPVRGRAALIALWGAALVVFGVCALGSRGSLGLLYLPSTLALALAAYVALLRRLAARRAAPQQG